MKLNVASGFKPRQGYINIDADPRVHPDIVRDIEKGLPFSDNTVEEILTEHTLEHINPDNIHFVMFEFWRVLQNGGRLNVVVPIGKGWSNSPEHKCPFDYMSWLFFTDWNFREAYKYRLLKKEIIGADITEELHFTLEAIKNG